MILKTVHAEIDQRVATIVLNRPTVLNCVNEQSTRELHLVLDDLASNDDLRVVVVRGEGRAFCTGIDLTALAAGEIPTSFFRSWEDALRRLETMGAVVIAAVHAHCLGGGLQLALACDVRVARDDATFGVTAVKEGIIPGMGMWRIARHAGLGRAKRLALTADVIDVRTALAWGLVDEVAAADAFDASVARVVDRVLAMAPTSTQLAKKLTNLAFDTSYSDFVDVFCEFQGQALRSVEHRDAMRERRLQRASRSGTDAMSEHAELEETHGRRT